MHCLDIVLNKWWKEKLWLLKLLHSILLNFCHFILDVIHTGMLPILAGAEEAAPPFTVIWFWLSPAFSFQKETFTPAWDMTGSAFLFLYFWGKNNLIITQVGLVILFNCPSVC